MIKNDGVYYTPKKLAKFIIARILKEKKIKTVLEPSSGSGVFLEEIEKENSEIKITAVEKNADELLISKNKLKRNHNLINGNYLDYHFQSNEKFDLIIGNPPYVNRKLISELDYQKSIKILDEKKIKISTLNLWIPFVVSSLSKVKYDGIVAFVLPAEFLSITSSKYLRDLLSEEFESIEIYSFNKVIFENIEQDTVVFIGYKEKQKYSYSYFLYENLEELANGKYLFETHYKEKMIFEKWSTIFLKDKDFIFLEKLKLKLKKINDYIQSSPGVVTGNNDFFIVNQEIIEKYNLSKYSKIILKKSALLKQNFYFSKEALIQLKKKKKMYIFIRF